MGSTLALIDNGNGVPGEKNLGREQRISTPPMELAFPNAVLRMNRLEPDF